MVCVDSLEAVGSRAVCQSSSIYTAQLLHFSLPKTTTCALSDCQCRVKGPSTNIVALSQFQFDMAWHSFMTMAVNMWTWCQCCLLSTWEEARSLAGCAAIVPFPFFNSWLSGLRGGSCFQLEVIRRVKLSEVEQSNVVHVHTVQRIWLNQKDRSSTASAARALELLAPTYRNFSSLSVEKPVLPPLVANVAECWIHFAGLDVTASAFFSYFRFQRHSCRGGEGTSG